MSVTVKEVAFIYHPAQDMGRARGFYEGVLGLKHSLQVEFAPGVWWVEYEVGGVALAVTNSRPVGTGEIGTVALEVEDIESAFATVKAAGVPIAVELTQTQVCRMCKILSPDGHGIILHQKGRRK